MRGGNEDSISSVVCLGVCVCLCVCRRMTDSYDERRSLVMLEDLCCSRRKGGQDDASIYVYCITRRTYGTQ